MPILCSGVLNAALFTVNGLSKRLVAWAAGSTVSDLTTGEMVVSGILTAPFYGFVLTPMDLVKTRLQMQSASLNKIYSGPIHCLVQTARQDGVRALFDGYTATVARAAFGLPAYFLIYRQLRSKLTTDGVPDPINSMVSGCAGGAAYWGMSYPFDTVKTQMSNQRAMSRMVKYGATTPAVAAGGGVGMRATILRIFTRDGIRGFYRGYLPCMIRSAPANGVAFVGVEATLKFFGQEGF